ncbi:hypothetical protein [Verrucomicrobium spinosum]|uniref:hypothetical protein n=2 Tax=Verrucomicrobium spinosum TaxID=2736 RepID=UPI0004923BA6|nr:hypothetical protein [Verrucomicrobium spinosum]
MQENSSPMPPQDKRYYSGEAVHAGDVVRFNGVPTIVVFVNDNREYQPGFSAEEWAHLGSGFMLQVENGALVFLEEADEDLDFVCRA